MKYDSQLSEKKIVLFYTLIQVFITLISAFLGLILGSLENNFQSNYAIFSSEKYGIGTFMVLGLNIGNGVYTIPPEMKFGLSKKIRFYIFLSNLILSTNIFWWIFGFYAEPTLVPHI